MTRSRATFDDDRKRTLARLLDALIPPGPGGRPPGAGEIGLGEGILAGSAALAPLLAETLDVLDAEARQRFGGPFAALGAVEGAEAVAAFAAAQPKAFQGLLFQTYAHYYQHPRVLEALGLEPRPPYPEGHSLEAGDLSLLDPVRRRAPLYRDV